MKIKELVELIEPYIEMPVIEFAVVKQMFAETNGRKKFNKTIRDKVEGNNLLNLIQTYQMYKINKNTKSLKG